MQTKTLQRPLQQGAQVQQPIQKPGYSQAIAAYLPIGLIMTLATALFTFRIESEGLWLDELTSIEDSVLAPLAAYQENQLRPLYYFLLKCWMVIGHSDGWLRGLSVTFAVISVFLTYRLARLLVGEAEAIIAASMVALSPLIVNHAQEVRMYTLSLCMGLAGTLSLAKAFSVNRFEKPNQKLLAGWSLFRLLAIYTVPLNVTLLLPDFVIIFTRFRKEKDVLISFAKWLLVLLVLWSPSVMSVVQESSPSGSFASHHVSATPPGADRIVRQLKFLTVWPFAVQSNAIAANFYKLMTFALCGVMGASIFQKHKSPQLAWIGLWFLIPLLPIIAFSYMAIPIWQSRYILFTSPFLFILLAAGITRLWKQWKTSAIVIVIAYLVAASGGLMHHYTVQERPDYKFNIETIEQYEQPGDALVWSYHYTKPIYHYYEGPSTFYYRTLKEVTQPADLTAWLNSFPTQYSRIWLTLDGHSQLDTDVIENAIKDRFNIEESFAYQRGSRVMLLTPLS